MGTVTNLFASRPRRFERFMAPHLKRLYRLAYRFTGDRSDSEDLVQELLLKLYPRTDELLWLESPGPWLARSLYHLFVDSWRRSGRNPLVAAQTLEAADPPGGDEPDAEAERHLLQRRLQRALQSLNPDQRALVALHDMEGYSLSELAESLALPIGTLKSRLHRARAQLRRLMEPCADNGRVTQQEESNEL